MTTDCDWPPSDHLGDLRPIVCLIEEMIVQWRSGARRPVEEYLARLPGITDDDAIELVFVEVLLRRELGEAATADDYVARFPRLAELLCAQFDRSGPALVEPTELEPSLQRAADGTAGAIRESLGESRGLSSENRPVVGDQVLRALRTIRSKGIDRQSTVLTEVGDATSVGTLGTGSVKSAPTHPWWPDETSYLLISPLDKSGAR